MPSHAKGASRLRLYDRIEERKVRWTIHVGCCNPPKVEAGYMAAALPQRLSTARSRISTAAGMA